MPHSPTSHHTASESHESAIDWLRRIVDSYVSELFDRYQPNPPDESRDGKVIRDPSHGFIHLSANGSALCFVATEFAVHDLPR